MTNSTAGAASSPGPSTPRTLSVKTPLDWLPSNVYLVSNPLSSRGWESPLRFQLWTTGSERARQCGTRLTSIFSSAVRRHKTFADARRSDNPTYQPGDKVRLSTQDLQPPPAVQKAECPLHWSAPRPEVTYLLQLPPRYRIHPSFHVLLLKPFISICTRTHRAGDTSSSRNGPGWYTRSYTVDGIPLSLSWSSCTQRPWQPLLPLKDVRSCLWRRG